MAKRVVEESMNGVKELVQSIEERLSVKLDPSSVKFRTQAGRQLSYIEGYTAIANANKAFGYLGWSSRVIDLQQVHLGYDESRKKWVCVYVAHLEVTVFDPVTGTLFNTHTDVGTGQGIMSSVSDAVESAVKEAVTDGLKRALRYWGAQFGLDLYSEDERREQGLDRPNGSSRPVQSAPSSSAPQKKGGSPQELLAEITQVFQSITDPNKKAKATNLLLEYAKKAGQPKLSLVKDVEVLQEALDALKALV